METPDPLHVDFAALRTLCLVYDLGSFSAAADKLDHNQSTISYTVERLRKIFHDPLFVRQGKGIAATDRCTQIVSEAKLILLNFEELTTPPDFDPRQSTETITISCNYYERAVLLPLIVRALAKEAPHMKLRIQQALVTGIAQLKRGECDALFNGIPLSGSDNELYSRHICSDKYICVMDKDHPLAKTRPTLKTYRDEKHILVTYDSGFRPRYLDMLEEQGVQLNPALDLPSLGEIENLLLGTGLIATIPKRIAQSFSKAVVMRPCPVEANFEIKLYWTTRSHHAPMHQWLRKLIADCAAQL